MHHKQKAEAAQSATQPFILFLEGYKPVFTIFDRSGQFAP